MDAEIGHLRTSIDGLTEAVVELKRDMKDLFTIQRDNFAKLFDRQD